MKKCDVIQSIAESGIVAVVRADSVARAQEIVNACVEGGIGSIEITFTVPGATEVIRALTAGEGTKPLMVGAGTVLDPETARVAILAGANFVVGPNFNEHTAKLCNRYGVPYLPGCMTITEMIRALESGCDVIKLFPGSAFNPSFVKDVRGPLPQARLMPTGGISLYDVQDWIRSGVVAVGVGGQLTRGTPGQITAMARQFVEKIHEAREEAPR